MTDVCGDAKNCIDAPEARRGAAIRRYIATGEDATYYVSAEYFLAKAAPAPIGTISVCFPSGYRIDGLTLEQAVVALGDKSELSSTSTSGSER